MPHVAWAKREAVQREVSFERAALHRERDFRRSLTDRLIDREPRSCHDTDIRPGTELRRRSVPKPAP